MSDDLREILITLSPGQFEQFAAELKVLRERGAESNTQAIISAVHAEAERVTLRAVDKKAA